MKLDTSHPRHVRPAARRSWPPHSASASRWTSRALRCSRRRSSTRTASRACSAASWATRRLRRHVLSSRHAKSPGRSRTASSRTARTASSRASACARWRAKRPASRIRTRSCCPRCSKRRTPRARFRASGSSGSVQAWRATGGRSLYLPIDPVESLDDGDKVKLLERDRSRSAPLDPRMTQVMASLSASHDTVLVMASDGTLAGDVRPLVRLNVSVIIEQDGTPRAGLRRRRRALRLHRIPRARSLERPGARSRAQRAGEPRSRAGAGRHDDRRARRRAGPACCCTKRSATGSKATSTARARRPSAGASGSRWPRRACTVVDDGTLEARRGSLNIDDEGTPTQCTMLIENGVLRGLPAGQAERATHRA